MEYVNEFDSFRGAGVEAVQSSSAIYAGVPGRAPELLPVSDNRALRPQRPGIAAGRMMIDRKSIKCGSISLAFSALGLWACCSPAFSQSAPTPPPRQVFYSKEEPLTDTIERVQRDPRPQTADGALKALNWLIYGNLSLGGAYDSNVFASPNQQPAYGPRFQPVVVAARNTGTQRTLIYGFGDIRWYPNQSQTDVVNTTAGLAHVWEIQRDLIFRAQLEATRSLQTSSLVSTVNGQQGPLYTVPVKYTSLFASTSIEKSFGRFFTAIGGSVTGNIYENTTDSLGNPINETFQNGTRSTLNGRLGYNISPIVYTFVEPSVNSGRFQAGNLDSNGYQIVGGLGTGRIRRFSGEIYGGVLTEHFSDPATPTLTRGIFGGRISWYPIRFVTVTGSFDQRLGTADFSPTVFIPGSVTFVDTAKLLATWEMLRNVTLEGSVQFQRFEYLSSPRIDDLSLYGFKTTYMVTRQWGVVLDYAYAILNSNTPGVAYNRNFVSLGATSKF